MLRQPAHEDLHRLRLADPSNAFRGDDVDHPGGEPTVGNDGYAFLFSGGIERLLLLDDLGVAAEVRAM